jgi:hypothetical protein
MANVKISQLTAKGSKIATTDRVAIAQDDGGGTFSSKYVTGEQLFGYKKYVATISQAGKSNPTVTVLENTLGGTVVWTRVSAGRYQGTLTGAFPNQDKLYLYLGNSQQNNYVAIFRSSADIIEIITYDFTNTGQDNMLDYNTIEIRVYP